MFPAYAGMYNGPVKEMGIYCIQNIFCKRIDVMGNLGHNKIS